MLECSPGSPWSFVRSADGTKYWPSIATRKDSPATSKWIPGIHTRTKQWRQPSLHSSGGTREEGCCSNRAPLFAGTLYAGSSDGVLRSERSGAGLSVLLEVAGNRGSLPSGTGILPHRRRRRRSARPRGPRLRHHQPAPRNLAEPTPRPPNRRQRYLHPHGPVEPGKVARARPPAEAR